MAAQAVLHARMAARANGHVGDKGCERQGRKEGSGERLSTGGKEREERKCPRGGLWPAEAKRNGETGYESQACTHHGKEERKCH